MATDVELTPAELADRAIPRMPSSVFRVAYVTLEHTVAVTSNGRVFAYFVPVSPAPRSAQQPATVSGGGAVPADALQSGGAAGRSEAPAGSLADVGASTPPAVSPVGSARRVPASGRRTSQPRTPKPSAATLLERANRAGRAK